MLIQGLLPVITLLPNGYILLAVQLFNSNETGGKILTDSKLPFLGYSMQQSVLILAYLNPFFDALATLLVVKAYREALKLTFGWKKKNEVAPGMVINVQPVQP